MQINLQEIMESMVIAISLTEIANNKTLREFIDKEHIGDKLKDIIDDKSYMCHASGTAFVALNIANIMKLDNDLKKDIYISAYLHDIGLAKVDFGNENNKEMLKLHCCEGEKIINRIQCIKHLAKHIKYHHENLDGTGPFKMTKISLISQILRISDLIDTNNLIKDETIKNTGFDMLFNNLEKYISKDISDVVRTLISKDEFWENFKSIDRINRWLKNNRPYIDHILDINGFKEVAEIYADIIDFRCSFTGKHSRGVARLAYDIAKNKGFSENKCIKFSIAGLLHDIGKLAINKRYIYKNSCLTELEYIVVKKHVNYTYDVLEPIKGIQDIIQWGISHHERLDGTGYFNNKTCKELNEEQRLIAVCDVYQALTEERPYREEMNKDVALKIIKDMVSDGKICPDAYEDLKKVI